MKATILFLLFPFLSAFGQQTPFRDGIYSNENEMVYAIEIYDNGTGVKMYLRENQDDKSIDYKIFNTGVIGKVKYKYFVQRLDGPKFSKRRQKELRIEMKDGIIVMQTYALLNNFYDTFTVYSDEIKYQSQSN